jgi:hypothetical protein
LGGAAEVMSQRELGSVLFATVGVFIAATRLPEFVIQPSILTNPEADRSIVVSGLVGTFLAVVLGVLLLLYRNVLARRLFTSQPSAPSSSRDYQAVALSVLGVYFVVRGLAGPVVAFGQVQASSVALLLLGLLLFLGARGLSNLWFALRFAGRSGGERAAQQGDEADRP